jgi:hypothetical protein
MVALAPVEARAVAAPIAAKLTYLRRLDFDSNVFIFTFVFIIYYLLFIIYYFKGLSIIRAKKLFTLLHP